MNNHKMEELKLPIIKGKTPHGKELSMDDYLKFVMFNLKYTVDIRAIREEKKRSMLNVPFRLK